MATVWLLSDYKLSVVDADIEILQPFTIYFWQPAKETEIATFNFKLVATTTQHKRVNFLSVQNLLSGWKIHLLPTYLNLYKESVAKVAISIS